jgi:hypothetical protein
MAGRFRLSGGMSRCRKDQKQEQQQQELDSGFRWNDDHERIVVPPSRRDHDDKISRIS